MKNAILLLTIVIIGFAVPESFASEGAEASSEVSYFRLENLEEVGDGSAMRMQAEHTEPNCNCTGNRVGILTPFLELVKTATNKTRRPRRALTCGTFRGDASWYTARPGALTASGRGFDPTQHWAAHKTLPFGTVVTVHCPSGQKVDVTIYDDGPHIAGRIIDLTRASADQCGITSRGHAPVTIEVKCPASPAVS
ncbi:MAG: septal ring lytic transglycosylase RlpA family protein [Bdellovibrionota bacterium]